MREHLGPGGVDFLDRSLGSVERLLPHVALSPWTHVGGKRPGGAVWTDRRRAESRLTIVVPGPDGAIHRFEARATRRRPKHADVRLSTRLDHREHLFCQIIASRSSTIVAAGLRSGDQAVFRMAGMDFEEHVVAEYLLASHKLTMDMESFLRAMHGLAGRTYENKPIVFGCLIDPSDTTAGVFATDFLARKKYRALSDGYRTAYCLSGGGALVAFRDISELEMTCTDEQYFPDWMKPMARAATGGVIGVVLSRQGELSILEEGTLRLTHRAGHWQFWNHGYIEEMIRSLVRLQEVAPRRIGLIVRGFYRVALDVAFRRTGGLLVLLRNTRDLPKITRVLDCVGGVGRERRDREFDAALALGALVQDLPRPILVELASLDGAVIANNAGAVLAYGAILQTRTSSAQHAEGSRTKAAIGASRFGLALKISSDGGTTVFHNGEEVIAF